MPALEHTMSFAEILQELPTLTASERQELIRLALVMDEGTLSDHDEAIIEQRMADHQRDPKSALSIDQLRSRLAARKPK